MRSFIQNRLLLQHRYQQATSNTASVKVFLVLCMWLSSSIRTRPFVSCWIQPFSPRRAHCSISNFVLQRNQQRVERKPVSSQFVRSMASLTEQNTMAQKPEMSVKNNLIIILAGPTGVGKSDVAATLCEDHKGIIVSADSVQAYKGVQIGANKPTPEELESTPHILVDLVDSNDDYNAAEWRRDTIYSISTLLQGSPAESSDDDNEEDLSRLEARRKRIQQTIDQGRLQKGFDLEERIRPVIVGGTMMYLQWLVHGRPDVARPSEEALQKARIDIDKFQSNEETGWEEAVEHVCSLGPTFESRFKKLCGKDWYRLRRILEVAYTVLSQDSQGTGNNEEMIEKLYSGQREGGLSSLGYDVRCFFICPDDRMNHTAIVDRRCEQMLMRGLLKETTDLYLADQLPAMASRAIGYRQTLDYLLRQNFTEGDDDAFDAYMNDFTTATRRYAKKQMQWFRKEKEFVFVPVPIDESKTSRVQTAVEMINDMCTMTREKYEEELLVPDTKKQEGMPLSARTKLANEKQGKGMKFYQFQRHILKPGSSEYESVLAGADECSRRIRKKRSTSTTTT